MNGSSPQLNVCQVWNTRSPSRRNTLTEWISSPLTVAPHAEGGSAVHGPWEQTSKSLSGVLAETMMRSIGARFPSSYYKKVYDGL